MNLVQALELLGGYTAGQWGMVTTRQAVSLGVDDVTLHRLRAAGLLETVRHGVHAATSSVAADARPEQAAWLSLRPDAAAWARPRLDPDGGVVSHASAARLHGLGDLPNTRVELTVPRRRTMRDPGVWLRRAELTEPDVTVLDGLPVTTPTRTVRDLLDQHIDASHIATIIRQAVVAGQAHLDELAEQIGPYARRHGVRAGDGAALLEHLLAQVGSSVPDLTTVTWGQLAKVAPEIAHRLRHTDPDET